MGLIHGGAYSFLSRKVLIDHLTNLLGDEATQEIFSGAYDFNIKYWKALEVKKNYEMKVEKHPKSSNFALNDVYFCFK